MVRKVIICWKIIGILIVEIFLYIGGVGGDVDMDLVLVVNGVGEYYVLGISLVGVLWGWMIQLLNNDEF